MLDKYWIGKIVPAIVKRKEEYGLWIEYLGCLGLIKIIDISFNPRETSTLLKEISENDIINVKILKILDDFVSGQAEFIASLKHAKSEEDPFFTYKINEIYTGHIHSIQNYGYFIELQPGVIAFSKKTEEKQFKLNEKIAIIIKNIDENLRKIEVQIKQ